jgi:hypothetical protein
LNDLDSRVSSIESKTPLNVAGIYKTDKEFLNNAVFKGSVPESPDEAKNLFSEYSQDNKGSVVMICDITALGSGDMLLLDTFNDGDSYFLCNQGIVSV